MKTRSSLPKIDLPGVGRRLDALRKALGLQKGDFADTFGLDRSSYSKVIKGEKPLTSDYAYIIAQRWGAPMDYLYKGDLSRIDEALRAKIIDNLNSAKP